MISQKIINEQFYLGKDLLDRGKFKEAILIYDGLIPAVANYEGNDEFKVTYETSLNNRGVGKCKLAIQNNDLGLYEEGIADFELSVEVSGITDVHELSMLTAGINLMFSREEKKKFTGANGEGLSTTNMS
ncbi:hypothetical protein [Chitinophaga niabensis]|uniref:Tetratricopeptide repeat-containing protein n=1 Tax=Chitinophaga niabensis TaxID=536979 RepID=A0A1N6KAR5_9BACT|nr:hypothetical protein [Chitinophaga niabensis]SIO53684.1 hypothetical protein SAMN04488055_5460 [Chitinophaga niabensis]